MAWIFRTMGPGEHVFGETTLVFDADSLAQCDDEEILRAARHFKTLFAVTAEHPEPDPEPIFESEPEGDTEESAPETTEAAPEGEPDEGEAATAVAEQYTQEDLETLTVAELREMATTANVQRAYALNKTELIAALLASQEG